MRRAVAPIVLLVVLASCSLETPPERSGAEPSPDAGGSIDELPGYGAPPSPTAPAPPSAPPQERNRRGPRVPVVHVTDGDTVRVVLRGREVRIRLIGIDTPELANFGDPVECLALAASRFTERRLEGRQVVLEFDVERRDRFGRTLAYVWRGRRLFNETLVERGLAEERAYPPNTKHQDRLRAAEDRARAKGRGIWSRC